MAPGGLAPPPHHHHQRRRRQWRRRRRRQAQVDNSGWRLELAALIGCWGRRLRSGTRVANSGGSLGSTNEVLIGLICQNHNCGQERTRTNNKDSERYQQYCYRPAGGWVGGRESNVWLSIFGCHTHAHTICRVCTGGMWIAQWYSVREHRRKRLAQHHHCPVWLAHLPTTCCINWRGNVRLHRRPCTHTCACVYGSGVLNGANRVG